MIDPTNGLSLDPTTQAPPPPQLQPGGDPTLMGGAGALSNGPQQTMAQPPAPPVAGGSTFAQQVGASVQAANKMNPGASSGPGGWAKNMVAGVQNALAGFDVGEVPAGGGWLYGVGKSAQNAQAQRQVQVQNKQKQQELDQTKTNQDRDYQLRLAENARQQATGIQQQQEHDIRMKTMPEEASFAAFKHMADETEFRQSQLAQDDTLKALGAKPLMVAGKETPAFDNLGDATQFALDNKLASTTHENDFRSRIVLGSDQKYHIYEVPDSGPKWVTLKDATGAPQKVFTDPAGALAYTEKVAAIQHSSAESQELLARAAAEKLAAGVGTLNDKQLVATDAYNKMIADPDFKAVPHDPTTGQPIETSPEYEKLDAKYGTSAAYKAAGAGSQNVGGEAYIRTLAPQMQSTIRAFGQGRQTSDMLPRGKEKMAYTNAINQAYPGYDEGEQKSYFATRTKYEAGGVQGQQVGAGMVASRHLYELSQLNQDPTSRVIGTPAYVAYQNKLGTVSDELAALYGTTTIPGIEELKSSLGNYTSRDKAIQTQATSMRDKMNNLQTQWTAAIPKYLTAAGVAPVMPGYDAEAVQHRDSLIANGKAAPVAPHPATHVFSTSGWLAAHPGGNANAAAAAATQQGFSVTK